MDITQIRAETLHCEDKLFVNSAGASLMPKVVTESVYEYFAKENGDELGLDYFVTDMESLLIIAEKHFREQQEVGDEIQCR